MTPSLSLPTSPSYRHLDIDVFVELFTDTNQPQRRDDTAWLGSTMTCTTRARIEILFSQTFEHIFRCSGGMNEMQLNHGRASSAVSAIIRVLQSVLRKQRYSNLFFC